ncbi:hypothetical protein ZWY2020_012044 [Hordeum vulgare]|nr:hypothetical protein ZWY2020_012044 [Hordeum vulgare]
MEFEEESTDDNNQDYSQMLCENSEDDEKYEIPDSIEDEDYRGLELDLMVFCRKHGKATERFVAFEGTNTGRRFLACAEQWVDEEWPEHLQNALHKLWLTYEDRKHDNRMACLEHSSTIHNPIEQKKQVMETFEKLDVENITINVDNSMKNMSEQLVSKDAGITKLKDVVHYLKFIHVAQGDGIRNLKFNHLKEKKKMSSDKRTLKFCFADVKKEKEKLDGCIAKMMKDKEKLSIKKSTLEYCIADLKKAVKLTRGS